MLEQAVKVSHVSSQDFEIATLVVQAASQHRSLIYVMMDNKRVNAKSIMGMTYLTLMDGDEVTVRCEGEDEQTAMASMIKVLQA